MFFNKKFVPNQSYIDSNQSNRTSFLKVNPKNLNFFESISASNTPKNLPKSGYTHNDFLATLDFFGHSHYFHVSQSYGVSESSCCETIKWIENMLIKHHDFALPGRKALLKSDREYEVVLIDATETPIERPQKKTKAALVREKETAHLKNPINRG